jgi:hypothetical protein
MIDFHKDEERLILTLLRGGEHSEKPIVATILPPNIEIKISGPLD